MLIFENAQVYNSELTVVAQAAQKLTVIFERLFLEMVLCYDTNSDLSPLASHSDCHACRKHIKLARKQLSDTLLGAWSGSGSVGATAGGSRLGEPHLVCERCEAYFHLACTSMRSVPKADWLCPLCISQVTWPKKLLLLLLLI